MMKSCNEMMGAMMVMAEGLLDINVLLLLVVVSIRLSLTIPYQNH